MPSLSRRNSDNTELQAPNTKHQTPKNTKLQIPTTPGPGFGAWILDFFWCLELGVWCFSRRDRHLTRDGQSSCSTTLLPRSAQIPRLLAATNSSNARAQSPWTSPPAAATATP